ncbi:uncharacterized protein TM35_000242250 [Trypanosoma theileri]|uniref:Uncharacterized protein n=1 Tax=Trypanosoma theileri TaxID=67003 RepID=A0A1X0NQT3_9TRYP|nr:uncharacterized protein TM35_000242250 [Trypanosoma theileri]ORC87075.1 hypothetical protein TM35_000242250 [Trypanosoma theileri]
MSLFQSLRAQRSGRDPVCVRDVLSWSQPPLKMSNEESQQLRELNTLSGEQFDLLKHIVGAWERGDFVAVNRWLQECNAYFDPNKPHLLVYFVGLGGIDLFVTLLCDVNVSTHSRKGKLHINTTGKDLAFPREFVAAIASLMRVLTELLVCQNELGWYYYDHYPGFFFQLLELARVPDLRFAALVMLEHLVLSVGPVLEISKIPLLQELIRTEDDATLAILCRVIALLIVPGVVLNQRESPHQRLLFPETLLPLQRIQRVIDSNVLWLIGEKGLVKRLVALCEVGVSNDDPPVYHGDQSFLSPVGSFMQPLLRDWYTTAIAPMPSIAAGVTPNIFAGLDLVQFPFTVSRMVSRANGNDNTGDRTDWRGSSGFATVTTTASGAAASTVEAASMIPPSQEDFISMTDISLQEALGNTMAAWAEDDATSVPSVAAVGSNVDFSWFVGCADAKQRWRMRDLTLRAEVDDNRPLLCGFGPVTDKTAYEAFQQQSAVFWKLLKPIMRHHVMPNRTQIIVSAQSEILFVLNLMLSTFFFGDVWCTLRECQWIKVANKFYDAAFESRASHNAISPYFENLRQSSELHQLPRFLTSSECREGTEVVEEVLQPNENDNYHNNSNNNSRDINNVNSSYNNEHDKERLPIAMQVGEDTEAYMRHGTLHGVSDDSDGFDDKIHQHEPNTIRKLELLRGVQEFWNAQDRRECFMLLEGDTSEQSAPLAMKIAITLAERGEDSCVETSACHALEGYLRCFSFVIREKAAANSPQSVLGEVLMGSILEHRVYNATYVPGLSGSLSPSKRIDSFFALLGELIRYHHKNLTLLQNYVMGFVSLQHLNGPTAISSSNSRHVHATSAQMEQLLRLPPLDRQEHEPFAKVLMRRIYRHGCDTNLFVRSLLLSLTPGLRSKMNYVWKPVTPFTVDAKESLDGIARIGDIVTGHPNRLSYIGKNSRRFIAILSERKRAKDNKESGEVNFPSESEAAVFGNYSSTTTSSSSFDIPSNMKTTAMANDSTVSSSSSFLSLWDMLQILLRAPHRLLLGERPFPRFFDDFDRDIIMGKIELPPIGPPPHLVVPLYPEMEGTENGGLASLIGLEKTLLQEPHKLVYGMLGPLNAERIQNAGRLCVVTTCVLLFVRAARLGGAEAVHDILKKLRPQALAGYKKWKKERDAPMHCSKRKLQRGRSTVRKEEVEKEAVEGTEGGILPNHSHSERSSCLCTASDGADRCSSFLLYGHCAPRSAGEEYYYRYGGCFFRNMFRLMCVWVGHYGACQRYVETLYYCTEVPFAESKCVVLYLMRILPDYFL